VLQHAALLDPGRLLHALELHRDGGVDLLVEPYLQEVDVEQVAAHGVELLVLDDHRAHLAAVDVHVDERRAVPEHVAQLTGADLEGDGVAVRPAVDDAGDEALAT
jgi:hypothetical protein